MTSSTGRLFSPSFKILFLLLVIVQAMLGGKLIAQSFSPPQLYAKDFIADYLPAQAVLNGVNPYLPLHELAARWMGDAQHKWLTHPTPHPPILILLMSPLGFLRYERAVQVWFTLELLGLGAIILILLRWWGSPVTIKLMLGLFIIALSWTPIFQELWFGQLNIGLLLLLLGAWLALRKGHEVRGGALLGAVIALKLFAWPFVFFLLLRRQWRSATVACGTLVGANLIAMGVLGVACIKDYYFKVGPLVASIYRADEFNYSSWTMGYRLFRGSGVQYHMPPLWNSALLATICDWALPLAILGCGLVLALRVAHFDTAFGLVLGVSILGSPTAWMYNLVLATIPIVIILRRLQTLHYPRKMCYLTALALLTPVLGIILFRSLALLYETATPTAIPALPWAVGLFTLAPAVGLAGLLWILWKLDGVADSTVPHFN